MLRCKLTQPSLSTTLSPSRIVNYDWRSSMFRCAAVLLLLLSSGAHGAEYMEKTPFQLSRAFSPGVITSGGSIVWVAGQTATQDNQGNNIANNFEAQVKQG